MSSETISGPILTSDGIPLKVSLKKAEKINKIRAFLLVFPLLAFILITFIIPIGDMLSRSVDDRYINTVFPKTFEVFKNGTNKVCLQKKFIKQCLMRLEKLKVMR